MTTSKQIAALNDEFRRTFIGGKVLVTPGVAALSKSARKKLVEGIISFKVFRPANDPYGEHDFGTVEVAKEKFFWKIDYYNHEMTCGSDDPADPARTVRVMTIMRAEEY